MRRKLVAFLITVIMLLSFVIPQASVVAADNPKITVLFSNGGMPVNSNTIYARFKVINDGASALNLGDLKLRYYYQKDADKPQNFWCDHAGMMNGYRYMDVTSKVKGTFIELQGSKIDNCLEISFESDAGSIPAGGSIEVQTRVARNDWTNYDQSNDYSYMPAGFYTTNNKIAAFAGADQVYGMQPPLYTHITISDATVQANMIKLTINSVLTDPGTPTDYVYSTDGQTWYNISTLTISYDYLHDKTFLEMKISYNTGDSGFKTPVYIATTGSGIVGNASPNVRNIFGQTLKIEPTICNDNPTENVTPDSLKRIVLTFSEHIYQPSVSDSDFMVEGFEVASVSVDNNADGKAYVIIELEHKHNTFNEKPKVTLVGSIEGMNRNVLAGPVEQTYQY